MRKISLALFVCLSSTVLVAQVHKAGIGIGTTNFQKPCIEAHYQFNYKLLYAQAGYMYNPGYEEEFYKELHFISAIAGAQTPDDKRISFITGLGIAYMKARNHPYNAIKSHLEDQFCPVLLLGSQIKITAKQFIAIKFYLDEFHYTSVHKGRPYFEPAMDARLNLCYIYKFRNSK